MKCRTPTTKDEHDEPLSGEDIIERGLLERHEWDLCVIKH